jgi:multidrug efflux pump subunit AcrA (membrane-fusion protein)
VHVEVDLPDADRSLPVNTTGEVAIAVGAPRPAVAIPLSAASITGARATLFVVEGDRARNKTFEVLGEQGSALYLETSLRPGTRVVTEGRALLADGDRVEPKVVPFDVRVSSTDAARAADTAKAADATKVTP